MKIANLTFRALLPPSRTVPRLAAARLLIGSLREGAPDDCRVRENAQTMMIANLTFRALLPSCSAIHLPPQGGYPLRHLTVPPVSLRLGHTRGKTTLSCFLTLSCRFATRSERLYSRAASLPEVRGLYHREGALFDCKSAALMASNTSFVLTK